MAYLYQDADMAAIDDITWTDCQVEHADPCDILCDNNLCVAYETECDFTNDCGDGTDEASCGNEPQNVFPFCATLARCLKTSRICKR